MMQAESNYNFLQENFLQIILVSEELQLLVAERGTMIMFFNFKREHGCQTVEVRINAYPTESLPVLGDKLFFQICGGFLELI